MPTTGKADKHGAYGKDREGRFEIRTKKTTGWRRVGKSTKRKMRAGGNRYELILETKPPCKEPQRCRRRVIDKQKQKEGGKEKEKEGTSNKKKGEGERLING